MNETTHEHKLWFRAKRFGWGWTPVTWHGWLATAIYVALLAFEIARAEVMASFDSDTNFLMNVAIPILLPTALFIMLCYAKGERPSWRWGK